MLLCPAVRRWPTLRTTAVRSLSQTPVPPPRSPRGAGAPTGPLDFDSGAYSHRSSREVARALVVFGICRFPTLVNNAAKVMRWSRRLLGRRLFERLMKASVYGQFVAGQTAPEVQRCAEGLRRLGVRPMLAVPIEEDVGENRSEGWYEGNLRRELGCVDLAESCGPGAMMQLKVTSLMGAELCAMVTRTLRRPWAAEDLAVSRLVQLMEGKDLQFRGLSPGETAQLGSSLRRLQTLAEYAAARTVPLLIDAELTYLNPAISLVTMALMLRFNQSQLLIWNTYQSYLKETQRLLLADASQALRLGLCFGVKLVRGAYMERERELALNLGYPDPVHQSQEDTDQSYRQLVDELVTLVRTEWPRVGLLVATHNEGSVRHLLTRMQESGLGRDCGSIHCAQLLGMSDHLSLALGKAGYSVYKSLPYGDVDSVVPYLTRRAQENRSALGGLRRERELLLRELRGRLLLSRGGRAA